MVPQEPRRYFAVVPPLAIRRYYGEVTAKRRRGNGVPTRLGPHKPQRRNCPSAYTNFGFRISAFFRASGFGLRISPRPPFSAPRPAPHWLRDFRRPPALSLVPGLGPSPLLVPEAVADLAGITKDGVMLSLRAAARASALGDLLLLPPVLAGRLHLRRPSPTKPFLSSVKCPTRSGRHLAARTGTRNL